MACIYGTDTGRDLTDWLLMMSSNKKPEKPSMMADGIKRVTTVFLSKLSSVARAPSQGTLTHTQGHPEALLGGGGLLMQAIMERLRRKSWFLPHAEEAVLGVAQVRGPLCIITTSIPLRPPKQRGPCAWIRVLSLASERYSGWSRSSRRRGEG